MYDDKNYYESDYSHSGVRSAAVHTPSEISQELRHNQEIDHWCVVICCKQNTEVGAVFDDFRAFQTAFKAFQDETIIVTA